MQPFEGIRVLDLTHVLAGPFCTFQLGVLGAEVIKIDPVRVPDMTRDEGVLPAFNAQMRGTYFMAQSAGKKSLALDLKVAEGREVFEKLVKTADVLVQNYAGAALDGLGLSYEVLSAINPALIYCSMSGFGQTGPKAGQPAYDLVIQAWSGIMAANGQGLDDAPLRVGPPMVDYGTGAQAAMAVSAALFQRTRTGRGQFIDVAMADAAFMLMSSFVVDTMATGSAPRPHGNMHPKLAGYSTYKACEGWITLAAWTNRQMADLMRVLGRDDLAEEVLATPRAEISKKVKEYEAIIGAIVATKDAQHWEDVMNAAHVPAARVRRIEETLAEPQVAARGVLGSYGTPMGGGAPDKLPLAAFTFAHGGPALQGPPPELGAHTDAILAELGYGGNAVQELRASGVVR
jgi:crotonobetainyl-CoA:carnitine CoA-transferase CaiB-like acyl-CoA transferase